MNKYIDTIILSIIYGLLAFIVSAGMGHVFELTKTEHLLLATIIYYGTWGIKK